MERERASAEPTTVPDVVVPPEVECQTGHQRGCFSGGSGTPQGICKAGTQFCEEGKWSTCRGEVAPKSKEECNGLDDNCDGTVDEGCDCKPGEETSCYTGPVGTAGVGICKKGTQTCDANGAWGACTNSQSPKQEECNGKDDDCDGTVDEDLTQECYSGPPNTAGVGSCARGKKICAQGTWSACTGETQPAQETCDNGKDDDCDGTVDEGNGRALSFSGNKQYVEIPHHNDLNLSGSFTIELWYSFEGVGSQALMILVNKHQRNINSSGYHLKIQTNNECAFSWWQGNDGGQLTLGACPTRRWAHLAFVYDHKNLRYRFYIDGKRVRDESTRPITIGANIFPLILGTESNTDGTPDYQGKMGPVHISKKARYSGASFTPPCTFTADSDSVGLWNLEDGAGSRVKDASSRQNHGRLVGPTWEAGRSCNAAKAGEGCTP